LHEAGKARPATTNGQGRGDYDGRSDGLQQKKKKKRCYLLDGRTERFTEEGKGSLFLSRRDERGI